MIIFQSLLTTFEQNKNKLFCLIIKMKILIIFGYFLLAAACGPRNEFYTPPPPHCHPLKNGNRVLYCVHKKLIWMRTWAVMWFRATIRNMKRHRKTRKYEHCVCESQLKLQKTTRPRKSGISHHIDNSLQERLWIGLNLQNLQTDTQNNIERCLGLAALSSGVICSNTRKHNNNGWHHFWLQ